MSTSMSLYIRQGPRLSFWCWQYKYCCLVLYSLAPGGCFRADWPGLFVRWMTTPSLVLRITFCSLQPAVTCVNSCPVRPCLKFKHGHWTLSSPVDRTRQGTSSQYQSSYFDLVVSYYLLITCIVFVLTIQIERWQCCLPVSSNRSNFDICHLSG